MSHFVPKQNMTEEDIKLQFITPAITAKWPTNRITMETKITDGKINLRGNLVSRQKPKKADYVLYINENNPIAIVEAKDNNHSISFGLQQAMAYAQMLDLPFAYSSNGDGLPADSGRKAETHQGGQNQKGKAIAQDFRG